MKSIEEKAKAYDEAIWKLREFYRDYDTVSNLIDVKEELANILPEICESEDERIRKELTTFLKNASGGFINTTIPCKIFGKWAAWLEKQGDVNALIQETYKRAYTEGMRVERKHWTEKQGEQKPADKVEPKFKIGDWIVHDMSDGRKVIRQIVNMTNKSYVLDGEDFNTFYFNDLENDYHLWTIADAMDGDVLAVEAIEENYQHPFVAIYKERGLDFFNSYCFIGFDGKFYEGVTGHSTEKIHPATKEQRDTLMKAMADAGYKWDADKKELKKRLSRNLLGVKKEEVKINRIVSWLENLNVADNDILLKDVDWLKSLKTRYTWKPSDEQMKALHDLNLTGNISYAGQGQVLIELYNDLKKIKE